MLCCYVGVAQVQGRVTDTTGTALPFVNIYLKNSSQGTTSNDNGTYALDPDKPGDYTVVFQYLGFQTLERTVRYNGAPLLLDVTLIEEMISLDEVVLDASEDPAYRIIRNTIERRKANLQRIAAYTADFYSRGLWRVDSIPESFMGQDVGDFEGQLDSTRSGIVYLSETVSKIAYQRPDNFKETITASKVSGNDNGFSFNSAMDANFSFYENTIDLNSNLISPIANGALGYYRYKLEGVFYQEDKLINKIAVIPKREKDKVWKGHIYIVEDDWQLYAVDLLTNGQAIQVPFVKELRFKQNFRYNTTENFWVKRSQTIDFSFGFFGFKGEGRFIAVYSNYNFDPGFDRSSFTNEVLTFKPEANKKDSTFWAVARPVPLNAAEQNDYVKKDSIQELRKSKSYLDSLDRKENRFKPLDLLLGYTYRDRYEKWRISYNSPLFGIQFNTVQGWNGKAGLSYYQSFDEENTRYFSASTDVSYGLADDRLRISGSMVYNFNRTNRLRLTVYGGSSLVQFNRTNPISPQINTFSTLFFERNYMKLYQLEQLGISVSREVINGVRASASFGYEDRSPVFNNTDYVLIPNDGKEYTPNNPRPDFRAHSIFKARLTATINFSQKYYNYPTGKFYVNENKYPTLTLNFENGSGSSVSGYDFSRLSAQVFQRISAGNKGATVYRLRAGTFIDGEGISFADYRHFNGNQTRVGTSFDYSNNFNLLPYYDLSTNKSYLEGHFEHNFQGWVLGKIPGLNWLNFNLVLGAHMLSTQTSKPYTEYSIGLDNVGFGKFRLLRVDYVRSYYNGVGDGAFIFGLKFLDILD